MVVVIVLLAKDIPTITQQSNTPYNTKPTIKHSPLIVCAMLNIMPPTSKVMTPPF
jgi:hypothetical protein